MRLSLATAFSANRIFDVGGGGVAPGVVENLALDGVPTTTEAGVAWDAPGSGGAVSQYRVQAQVAGGSWTSLVVDGTVGSLGVVLVGLSAHTTYDVRVRAEGIGGNSAWVTEEDLVLTLPGVPTITAITTGDTELEIEWMPGSGLTYKAYRHTADDFGAATLAASGLSGPNYTFTGLTNGTPYYLWLVAVNATGDSAESASESGTPEAAGGGGGISVVGYASKAYNDGTLAKPGTIELGDLLVCNFTDFYDNAPPTGWTRLEPTPGGNAPYPNFYCQGFYRFADASDVSASNYNGVFGAYAQGYLFALRGVDAIVESSNWTSFTSADTEFPIADLDAGAGTLMALLYVDSYQAGGGAGNGIIHPSGFSEEIPGNTYGGWPVALSDSGSGSGTLTWETAKTSFAGILIALLQPAA